MVQRKIRRYVVEGDTTQGAVIFLLKAVPLDTPRKYPHNCQFVKANYKAFLGAIIVAPKGNPLAFYLQTVLEQLEMNTILVFISPKQLVLSVSGCTQDICLRVG